MRPSALRSAAGWVISWTAWLTVGIGLDLAVWSQLRRIHHLAENPGCAGALALCWVHPFVLPALFGRPWRGLRQLLLGAAVGSLAAPLAVAFGFLMGLQTGSLAFMVLLAFASAGGGLGPYGQLANTAFDVLFDGVLWSGFAAGAAVAASAAFGMAAAMPNFPRPRRFRRVVLAGACASAVFLPLFLPDEVADVPQPPLREATFLLSAALPALILVNWWSLTPARPA